MQFSVFVQVSFDHILNKQVWNYFFFFKKQVYLSNSRKSADAFSLILYNFSTFFWS